jgi:hypothetical protein
MRRRRSACIGDGALYRRQSRLHVPSAERRSYRPHASILPGLFAALIA